MKIFAHRGASAYAPENTLESFALAAEMKPAGIELDVQRTADGELVVCHDETLDRTSDGQGWLKDYTLAELKGLHFNKTHPEYKDARIPTLREVYELMRPTGLLINVELKTGIFTFDGIEEQVAALTREMKMEEQVFYSSFNHFSVRKMKELAPFAGAGLLYADRPIGVVDYAKHTVHADALHPAIYHLTEPDYVKKAHEAGLTVRVWTVDGAEHVRQMMALGVDAIFTNEPDRALAEVRA